jgi:hypothetical protein
MITPRNVGAAAVLTLIATSGAMAETAMEKAVGEGAQRLGSDEIAAQLVGKTVTFKPGPDKEFLIHYGPDNDVSGKLIGGDWSDTGIYGVTDADSICLSWRKSDEGRLRCFYVVVVDGMVKKFKPDGSFAGDVVSFEDGKVF